MAFIYTARNITSSDKTTPLFTLKGIAVIAPTTIMNLNIQGIPLVKQVAYTQYATSISSFIHACMTGKMVTVSPMPLAYPYRYHTLPISPPATSFSVSQALSVDQAGKLLEKLDPGASKTIVGKTTVFTCPILPIDKLQSIMTISMPFFNAGRDAVNPRGYQANLFLNTVISMFVHIHSYPAFRSEDPDSLTLFEQLVSGEFGGSYHTKDYTTKVDGKDVKKTRDLTMHVNLGDKRKRGDAEMDLDDDTDLRERVQKSSGYIVSSGKEMIVRARPVMHTLDNIGGINNVPDSPGIVFPYFHGLIQPDMAFMSSIVLRRFYQLLGTTHEKCQEKYLEIRHGINSLATTHRGMELCHMLLGVDLALDTQSRLYLIIEKSKYLGFALLGSRYAIFSNTKWHAPGTETELSEAIHNMDPHDSAVTSIIEKFKKMSAEGQYTGSVDRAIFQDPDRVVEELSKLAIADIEEDEIRELDRLIRNFNYIGAGYLTMNPHAITEMLTTFDY